jgi:hypothetical protein
MARFPNNKLAVVIFSIALLAGFIGSAVLYLMNALDYIPWLSSAVFAVILVSAVISSKEYTAYFSKHNLIYKVILALAFAFLITALIAKPAYYLATILFGTIGFDFTLTILMIIINDQKKI